MLAEMFIFFNGNCREAVEFYAKVFKTEVLSMMTFDQAPRGEGYEIQDADRDRIMYAGLKFDNMMMMFSDSAADSPVVMGNNVCPTISMGDKDEVARIFGELKQGGEVSMELQRTFFSELYGSVTDRFGVSWEILYYVPNSIG